MSIIGVSVRLLLIGGFDRYCINYVVREENIDYEC